jgi:hypothetical protein
MRRPLPEVHVPPPRGKRRYIYISIIGRGGMIQFGIHATDEPHPAYPSSLSSLRPGERFPQNSG